MAKPPNFKQKRYRGRIRNDIRSVFNHINNLINWQNRLRAMPLNHYPNQLASDTAFNPILSAQVAIIAMLNDKGAIPSR